MSERKIEGAPSPMSDIAHPDFQPRRRTPWGTVEGRVISLVSRKGGVGKTTSAVNLGAALALSGHTVLIVGTDPQCGVCRTLGVSPHELTTCLSEIHTGTQAMTDIVHPSALQDLFFVSPRILTLEEEEAYLEALERDPETFTHQIDRARLMYDTILIDCPPGLGAPTRAALLASDSYLVPLQAEELCRDSVDSLLEFVDTFRDRNFPGGSAAATGQDAPLALEGIFLTMASQNTRMGRHVAEKAGEDFPDVLFEASVPRTTRLSEMALRGKPAVIYDRRSAGSRAFFDLADELVQRYCQTEEITDQPSGPTLVDQPDSQVEEAACDDRLARFLDDIGGSDPATPAAPAFEEPTGPEIVSLDELLAEEEDRSHPGQKDEEWDAGFWNRDSEGNGRFN